MASVIIVAVLLVCAPLGMGRIAASRIDRGLDKLVKQAPYIKVAERKWTWGWFHSEQQVTFEFDLPRMLHSPKPVTALADATPPLIAPVRFTVHSNVSHGPVLGSSGLGLAKLDSTLVIGDDIRKKVEGIFGPGDIVQISTRMGFFGGGTTTLSGKGRTVQLSKFGKADTKGTLAWGDFSLVLSLGRNASTYEVRGRQPRLEITDTEGGNHMLLANLAVDGSGSRVTKDLYDGGAVLGIGKVAVTTARTSTFEMQSIKYGLNTSKRGDFMNYALQVGTGAIKARELEAKGLVLKEVHYDMTLRHLHIETMQKMMEAMRTVYAKNYGSAGATPAELQAAMLQPLKEHGIELIKHDPELSLDRIGLTTPEGEGIIKGLIKLEGVTDEDLAAGVMAIVPKINADLTIEIAQAMLEKIPSGATAVGMGIDQGYLKRENGKLVSHIEFKHGGLTVNGKAPAMGGLPFGGGAANPSPRVPPAQ